MSRTLVRAVSRLTTRRRLVAGAAVVASASAFAVAAAPAAQAATGPYRVSFGEPADLRNHTVFRPAVPAGQKLPVLVWGQGGCIAQGLVLKDFLTEIASHGILVIGSGAPYGVGVTTWGHMVGSVKWVKAQNMKTGGQYTGRLIPDKIAASGWSCGGLEALKLASNLPEVAALALMNSGQLQPNQAELDRIKVPTLYVLGGSGDVAYANGSRDYNRLPATVPAFLASNNSGHLGTYFSPSGGPYAQILRDWILWHVNGSTTASKRFVGADCTICTERGWEVRKRNID